MRGGQTLSLEALPQISLVCSHKVSSLLWIPAEATLSFTTSIIKMEWLLKFEFVTVPRDHGGGSSGDLDDTVEMSLPIEVIAPQNVGECDLWEDTVARRLRLQ